MVTVECQSRELAEVLSLLDGMFAVGQIPACREPAAYVVSLEHVISLVVKLCVAHEQLAAVGAPGYLQSIKLRPPS